MKPYYYKALMGSLAVVLSTSVFGHGLISEPASRNWTCGAIIKPDQAEPGSICAQAFEDDFNGGYQFMSVLTHTQGRAAVSQLPDNVCSFGSSTWNGEPTPWDKPLDWPAHEIDPGPLTLTWDISWGPHWDDTEEFRYWITKPDFQYQVGRALTWDDFEEDAFCVLGYDDSNPNANPNVWTDRGANLFHTQCQVPERAGRHVIYAEWGRNEWTYERFHTCVDVQIGGDGGGGIVPVVANIHATPDGSVFVGDGQITLDGTSSQGNNLSYQWSVDAANPSLYSLSSTTSPSTVLTLAEPAAESEVTVHLQVTGEGASSSTAVSFTHVPATGDSNWIDLGAVSGQANALSAGDQVQLRLVDNAGADTYYPANALVLTEATAGASAWPYALAQAVNAEANNIRVGTLDANGDVNPTQSATDNRVYAAAPASYSSAFVQIREGDDGGDGGNGEEPGAGSCEYVVVDDWGAGFVANIRITNNGSSPINGWNVNWEYSGNTTMTSGWNAEFSGSNPYSASNMGWNGEIQPGDTVEFGFQGEGSAETPEVTGSVCD